MRAKSLRSGLPDIGPWLRLKLKGEPVKTLATTIRSR
jgi:hypothetical protein